MDGYYNSHIDQGDQYSSQAGEVQDLLRTLGQRLRRRREELGWSVSFLAQAADISRRYVTEAEAGRANLTVAKLHALARALRVPLEQLCAQESRPTRGLRIALVGLRGAGKSTVGRQLALALEVPFVELDRRVEALAGLSLAEIFDLHGVEAFHRFEAEALERVLAEGERMVVATGGSIVDSPANFTRLRETCRTVWLRARGEVHYQRVLDQGDRRPMQNRPRALEELRQLLGAREPEYRRCELSLDVSDLAVEDVVAELERALAP